ncbi:MAG: tape measure protein [Firmicutes bacterium]|nr:tape measure protein [Bacillota bacterium]
MLNYGGMGLGLIFTAKDMATVTMRGVENQLRSVSDTADAASRRFASSMRLMKTGLVGLGAGTAIAGPLVLVGKAAFDTSAQFKQITKTFEMFLGSAERATQHVEELQKFAETTPFEFLDLTQYSRQMQSYGFQVKEIIPMLTAVGDAAAGMQDPMAMDRIIRALGQIHAKGRLVGQELLQLTETGLPIYDILQEQLGLTSDQLSRIADQGVPAQKAIEAILAGLTKRYGGLMAELMKTPQGIVSNMRDAMTRLRRGIGDVFYDEVVVMLQNVLHTLKSFADTEAVVKGIGEGFRGIVAVVKPVVDAVLGLVRGVAKFIEKRPWVASFAVTFAGVSAVVLMVASSFMFLRGVIGVIPLLLQKIGLSGKFAIGSLAWPVLAVSAAIAGLRLLVERNVGGIGALWRGVATLIANTKFDPKTGWVSALPEALRDELKKLNLLDIAVKIWMFTVRAREFLQGFVEGVRGFVKDVSDALRPIGAAFWDVGRAIVAPFISAGTDLTKTASDLPIKTFRDFGLQVGRAFRRALPFIRGFAEGIAAVMRTAGAILGPAVRVVIAIFRTFGDIISWVAERFARSGRDLPTDKISMLGKVIGGLVASLLLLKGLALVKLTLSLGAANVLGTVRGLLGPIGMARKGLLGLPNVLLNVGAKFDGMAKAVAKFDPKAIITGFRRIGSAAASLPTKIGDYFRLLKDGAALAGEGLRNFGMSMLAAGTKVLGFLRMLMLNPFTLWIVGIAAVVAGIYLLWKNWDKVTAFLGRSWARIREFATELSPTVVKALAVFLPFIGIPILIIRNWDRIRTFFIALWRGIVAGASGFIAWIRGIPSWFRSLPGQIVGWFRSLPGLLVSVVKKALFGALFAILLVFYGIPLLIIKNWDKIKGFFANLWAAVVRGGATAISWFVSLPGQIWNWLKTLPGHIGAAFSAAWDAISSWIASIAKSLWGWVTGVPAQVSAGVSSAWQTLISSLPEIWSRIVEFFTSLPAQALEWGKNLISSFIEGIKSMIGGIGDIAKEAAGAVRRFLGIESPAETGPLAMSHLWGPNLVEMFAKGLRKGIPLMTAASMELASALAGGMAGAEVPVPRVPEIAPVEAKMFAPSELEAGSAAELRAMPVTLPVARPAEITPPVRPIVVQVPIEKAESAQSELGARPKTEVIQLVVDGRVLTEIVRAYDREDRARSAPW